MEGVYPIIINGELAGKLTVASKGAWTVFDAVCHMLPGIVRLSVYGENQEGYLGVLAPEGDGLSLHKTFSRAAMRDFPATIDAVEPAGRPTPQAAAQPAEEAAAEPLPVPDLAPVPEAPAPAAPERCWYASPDGVLVCFDGEKNLVAFPAEDSRIPPEAAGEPCTVEGRGYRVFPTKNGRIVWE